MVPILLGALRYIWFPTMIVVVSLLSWLWVIQEPTKRIKILKWIAGNMALLVIDTILSLRTQ